MFKNKKGLTLIELLVVLAILGILASILLSNMTGARARARDAKRKGDLDQIRKALEMYKQDNLGYPATANFPAVLSSPTPYMTEVPQEPLGGNYNYQSPRTASDNYTMLLYACLENVSDPDADTTDGDADGTLPDDRCGGGTADGRVSYTLFEP